MACARLAALAVVMLVAACTSTATQSSSTQADPPLPKTSPVTITVLGAGMIQHLVQDGLAPAVKQSDDVTLNYVHGNSVALTNSVKNHTLTGDLFMSADAAVNQTLIGEKNGNWVSWFVVFAQRGRVGIQPKKQFCPRFNRAHNGQIPQVLEQPGIRLGRDNPNRDPLGYYDLFVAQLAQRYYKIPGLKQKILGADNNPNQVLNTSPDLLRSGKLDAEFMYINEARDDGIPYVTLPDQINLSNPSMAGEYAQASYTTNVGQTFHGAPIQASIAPLRNGNLQAATQTVQLLAGPHGADLLRRFHFIPTPILAGGDTNAMPAQLKTEIMGIYHSP